MIRVLVVFFIAITVLVAVLITSVVISFPSKENTIAFLPVTNPTPTSSMVFTPQPPTLESLFSQSHEWVATLSAERVRTIIATGDVLLAREVNRIIQEKKNPNWPFEKTRELLQNADVTFINLETPLIKDCPLKSSGFVFCGESSNVEGLLFAGIDVVNFSNNHASNYGEAGVLETVDVLKQNNLLVSGVSGPVYHDVNVMTFAFLGYNEVNRQPGTTFADEAVIQKEITQAKQQSDSVIVQFHWGTEYTHVPSERQKDLARFAIDKGADLIVGNHPHWWQGLEIYKGKVIMYSHGNFVFDQMWSEKTREGLVGKYIFYDSTLIDIEFIPIKIMSFGQPEVISDDSYSQTILSDLKKESFKLSGISL